MVAWLQGNEADVHNLHWHGIVLEKDNTHVDQFSLLSATVVSARLIADNAGTWLFHCHVLPYFAPNTASLRCIRCGAFVFKHSQRRSNTCALRLFVYMEWQFPQGFVTKCIVETWKII